MGKLQTWLVIGGFSAYVIFFARSFDHLANLMSTLPPFQGMLIYFASHIEYLLILWGMFKFQNKGLFKTFTAWSCIVIAADIISFPRVGLDAVITGAVAATNSDTIILNFMTAHGLAFSTAWWIYYTIVPIILVVSAIAILSPEGFLNYVKGMSRVDD